MAEPEALSLSVRGFQPPSPQFNGRGLCWARELLWERLTRVQAAQGRHCPPCTSWASSLSVGAVAGLGHSILHG